LQSTATRFKAQAQDGKSRASGQVSFNDLRLRGGHAFPAFNAARLASRIATICFRMRARQLLWQQEAVRALQQGKDPPPPRLWRDKRGGAGADA